MKPLAQWRGGGGGGGSLSPPAAETHALVLGGDEAAGPMAGGQRLVGLVAAALGDHDDERGEVGVLRAQSVREPGSDRRATWLLRAGLDVRHSRVVVDRFGVDR